MGGGAGGGEEYVVYPWRELALGTVRHWVDWEGGRLPLHSQLWHARCLVVVAALWWRRWGGGGGTYSWINQ